MSRHAVAWGDTAPDGPPVETATPSQIRDYLTTNGPALRFGALALTLAGIAVVVLAAQLGSLLRSRQALGAGPESVLPALLPAGGVLVAVNHWLDAAASANTAVQALDGQPLSAVDDSVLRTWYAVTNVKHLYGDLALAGMLLVMTAAGIGAWTTRFLPRWVAILGLIASAAGAVGITGVVLANVPLSTVWFGGLFGWTLWVPSVAVSLLVTGRLHPDPAELCLS